MYGWYPDNLHNSLRRCLFSLSLTLKQCIPAKNSIFQFGKQCPDPSCCTGTAIIRGDSGCKSPSVGIEGRSLKTSAPSSAGSGSPLPPGPALSQERRTLIFPVRGAIIHTHHPLPLLLHPLLAIGSQAPQRWCTMVLQQNLPNLPLISGQSILLPHRPFDISMY